MSLSFLHLIFFISPLLINASHNNHCYTSSCSRDNPNVRFPFSLFPYQPESCGQIGFNLLCTDDHKTSLKLLNSEPFLVKEIDYVSQRISLKDPKNCLAKRLLNFNTSGSPFSLLDPRNFTFLICPKKEKINGSFRAIDCLSNSTSSFFVVEMDKVGLMPSSCQIFKTFPWSVTNNQELWLKWDSPDCRDCERGTYSRCGFINNSSLQVKCFDSEKEELKTMCISLAIPFTASILCVGVILWVLFCNHRIKRTIQQHRSENSQIQPAVVGQPSDEEVTRRGLDESTIESYKKVELGESRRLPSGSNDVVCPICLSEYATKEIVRCLPECEHCFHTECIDAWLKLHSSCPLCRSNPSPN